MGNPIEDKDETDCIVARCGRCKHVVYAAVNIPKVMDRKAYGEIQTLVRLGCSIEHMPVHRARKEDWGCDCPKPEKKKTK